MTPEAQAIFDLCDERTQESLKAFDEAANKVPLAFRLAIPAMRAAFADAIRASYLAGVWETLMGRALRAPNVDWEAEIESALANRF